MKRQRGRNRKPGGGGGNNTNPNRSFESNGPDGVKIRGNAQHVYEKYQQLARDASASGDRVLAENYLQHAEHYFRVLRTLQPQRPVAELIASRDQFGPADIDFEDETGAYAEQPEAEGGEEGQGGEEGERAFNDRQGERHNGERNGDRREFRRDRDDRDRNRDRDRGERPQHQGERQSDRQGDRPEGERREFRDGDRRESRRERFERRREERRSQRDSGDFGGEGREDRADPMPTIQPEAAPLVEARAESPRAPRGDEGQALPAFLTQAVPPRAPADDQDEPAAEAPKRPRRRRSVEVVSEGEEG